MASIAIIGAGLAGLVVARRLRDVADVTLYEKSRGAGGRIATRYAGEFEFDHGAQFITAQTSAFRVFLDPMLVDGHVADWPARFAEIDGGRITALRRWEDGRAHYVGVPRMNQIGKHLSSGLDIRFQQRVVEIKRNGADWVALDDDGDQLGTADWMVLTAPAAQTAELAGDYPDIVSFCSERSMLGCYALMLGFARPPDLPWDAALVRNADISWMSVNSSKPGREGPFAMVVHSTNAWATEHIDENDGDVIAHLVDEASRVLGMDLDTVHTELHRWRYANIARHSGPTHLVDDASRLAVCGDWFIRGRVEAAFTSACELAAVLRQRITSGA